MILRGENFHLFVGGKSIGFSTNSTIEISANTLSVSSKDSGAGAWDANEISTLNWNASSENLIGNPYEGTSYDELVELMIKREPVEIIFGLKSVVTSATDAFEVPTGGWTPKANSGYRGSAYITSISLNTPNAESATMSVSLTGTGPLTKIGNAVAKANVAAPAKA